MSLIPVRGNRIKTKTSKSEKRTFVPRLEVLETRDLLSTFTVTNTSGSGDTTGSLVWAINQSNNTPGHNTINFDIGGGGKQVINIGAVQYVNNTVTIDGTTQPGYNGTPLISVQGNSNVSSLFFVNSAQTNSSGTVIQGLDMYDYTANAVTLIAGSNNDTIQNNWMGFYIQPNGAVSLNTSLPGDSDTSAVGIQSSNNLIRNNVMSGCFNAVRIGEDPAGAWSGKVYSNNQITGNYIGTDPSGSTSAGFGNTSDAVFLGSGVRGTLVGPYNVMSGNVLHGVEIFAPSANGNVVFKNDIGTDKTGQHALAGQNAGIDIANGASGNTIGGAFGGNIISGNSGVGVYLGLNGFGVGNSNFVQGNIIGLNPGQTGVIGTGNIGISINSGSAGNIVQGNVICGAASAGVLLQGSSFNTVNGNYIGESSNGAGFANGQFGITAIQGSNSDDLSGNFFGINPGGEFRIDSSSASTLITTFLNMLGLALQDLAKGNIGGVFQVVGNMIALVSGFGG